MICHGRKDRPIDLNVQSRAGHPSIDHTEKIIAKTLSKTKKRGRGGKGNSTEPNKQTPGAGGQLWA